MFVLGIESSCDETACAVVRNGSEVLGSVTAIQDHLHEAYGGVVPEIAARAHMQTILPVIEQALTEAKLTVPEVDVLAIANHPGLIGSLLVGLTTVKTLSVIFDKPVVAMNHLQCHLYANCLSMADHRPPDVGFPFVGLVVSGGHTSLVHATGWLDIDVIGSTHDDAAGEAFDKVAVVLGLGYPGGPAIERAACAGDPAAYKFPRSLMGRASLDFSFSGLKTSVLYTVRGHGGRKGLGPLSDQMRADLAASFQEAVVDTLVTKVLRAVEARGVGTVVLGGGVVANTRLRDKLTEATAKHGLTLHLPPRSLCTDNAAMVAGLGYPWARAGRFETLSLEAVPT